MRVSERLLSQTRAAVQKYDMIHPGDSVAVGVSGGKDSIMLLELLARLRRFYPAGSTSSTFTLTAITLDPMFNGNETDYTPVSQLCERLEVPHIIERTELWKLIFEQRTEANPCSLCARMRRGTLHRAAKEAGCSVIALGHHKNDVAETLMMNLLSGGTLDCFKPNTYLSRRDIHVIRPMIYIDEKDIEAAVRHGKLPVVKSKCPVDGKTGRQRIKELIASLEPNYGPVSEKLLGAVQKGIWKQRL